MEDICKKYIESVVDDKNNSSGDEAWKPSYQSNTLQRRTSTEGCITG